MLASIKGLYYQIRGCLGARRFRGYGPQAVTWKSLGRWLDSYEIEERGLVIELLRHIRYIDSAETLDSLVKVNEQVTDRLFADGITWDQIIYVQIHDAGSSSGVTLNILRDAANLQSRGKPCHLIDASSRSLSGLTSKLGEGAIIYIDDFSGTGNQFLGVRNEISPFISGSFVEYFLAPCITREAASKMNEAGVEPAVAYIEEPQERPLGPLGCVLPQAKKERLLALGKRIDKKFPLGYRNLGTMTVYQRQCPNSVPLIVRGSKGQKPFRGILPRTTDLW